MEAVGVGRRAAAILIDSVLLSVVAYLIALATGGTLVVKARIVIPFLVALAFGGFHHPESQAASPRYSDMVISDASGGAAKSTFKPQTAKIFLHAKLVDVPPGSKVKSDWIAVKTNVAPPNYKIDSVELNVGSLVNSVDFNFIKPTAGWPEGDYRVDLFINGKPAGNVKFQVAK